MLEGAAVKSTFVPKHTEPAGDFEMVRPGASAAGTVMVRTLLVAVEALVHVSETVSTQVTSSPFTSVEELYVLLLVPTFTPFTFH